MSFADAYDCMVNDDLSRMGSEQRVVLTSILNAFEADELFTDCDFDHGSNYLCIDFDVGAVGIRLVNYFADAPDQRERLYVSYHDAVYKGQLEKPSMMTCEFNMTLNVQQLLDTIKTDLQKLERDPRCT